MDSESPRYLRRAGLVLAGFISGVLGLGLGVLLYLEAGQVVEARSGLGDDLRLAREQAERIDPTAAETVRFELDGVVLREEQDTVLAAGSLFMSLAPETLGGPGAIVFRDVEIAQPVARIIQSPAGAWNYERALGLDEPPAPGDAGESRPIVFQNASLSGGRLRIAMPAGPPAEEGAAFVADLATAAIAGTTYTVYDATGVEGTLSSVRIGGPNGWRVEFAGLRADIVHPHMALAGLTGWAEQEAPDGVAFDLDALRVGGSSLAGDGTLRFADSGLLYDLRVTGTPLRLVDFQPLFPNLPEEGLASFVVGIESISPERLALDFSELDFDALGSRIVGRLGLGVGGDAGPSLFNAELDLAPLRLASLQELGILQELPVGGAVEGRLTTAGATEGYASVDLTATLVPPDDVDAEPSIIVANGEVALAGAAEELALDGLAVTFRPLRPATFAAIAPDNQDLLRGAVTGSIVLGGTLREVYFAEGTLEYAVGQAAPTRLSGINGRASLSPELSYEVSASAQPIALATINELFPAAPFRSATLTGPVTVVGGTGNITLTADLTGPAGGIDLRAAVQPGDPLAFNLTGSVSAFEAGILLRPELPVEGPLTGTFSASGTTENLAFDVNLGQREGRFALRGSLMPSTDPPIINVQGDVADFRLGAVVGEPELFPEPMSGPVLVRGGGDAPYLFDLDLGGPGSELAIGGMFIPGDVPSYRATGRVAGLDLSRLPLDQQLPASSLSASIDVDARGLDLETLAGEFEFDATASTLGGRPLDAALGRVEIRGGVMYIDTLNVTYDRNRLIAAGAWGLQTPSAEPLRYSFVAPDLAALGQVLTPIGSVPLRLAGSITTAGSVAGSFEYPVIDGTVDARNIRYNEYGATSVRADLDIQRLRELGWSGSVVATGGGISLPGGEEIVALRIDADGNEESVLFDLEAERDSRTSLAANGALELAALRPRAVALDQLSLQLAADNWTLMRPANMRFTVDDGLAIEDLLLQRSGQLPGTIAIDGRIPPAGTADLAVDVDNFDLSDLQYISPRLPEIEGMVSLDAVISGPQADPEMNLLGRFENIVYEGASAESIVVGGTYVGQRFEGSAEATAAGARLLQADLSIPMNLTFQNLVPSLEDVPDAPLEMTIVADSLPLDLVAALTPALSAGSGVGRAFIEVGGTTDSPALDGWARLDGGAFYIEPLGVRYSDIDVDLALAGSRMTVNSLSARSGGTLVVSGAIDFPTGISPRIEMAAGLDGFRVMNAATTADLSVSGQLAVAGAMDAPVVTGGISISESTIFVPELATAEPSLDLSYLDAQTVGPLPPQDAMVGPGFLSGAQIDGMELVVDESVWLESNEMRVQIAGDLIVYLAGEELRVFGGLTAPRGTYTLEISGITRSFDVVSGRVQFFGTGDLNPSLDITAGYRVRQPSVGRGGDVTVLVQLSGTLLTPRIQLTSDAPVPLSETDLISYLVFGQPSFELGGVNAGFAQQVLVQEVVGGLVASGLERPILRAGLCDWVRVRPGATSTVTGVLGVGAFTNAAIECGWELAPDLFLTGQTGFGIFSGERAEGRLGLEWQIDNQWMWEASYGAIQRSQLARIFDTGVLTQFSTDIRRQWEYGRSSQGATIDLLSEDEPLPPPEEDLPTAPVLDPSLPGQ